MSFLREWFWKCNFYEGIFNRAIWECIFWRSNFEKIFWKCIFEMYFWRWQIWKCNFWERNFENVFFREQFRECTYLKEYFENVFFERVTLGIHLFKGSNSEKVFFKNIFWKFIFENIYFKMTNLKMYFMREQLLGIGWVRPNKNHNFRKINLSDITRRYLFKIYFSTDIF